MRRLAVLGCAALAALTSGCFWGMPGQNADRQGHNPLEDDLTVATVASLTEEWTVQLDEGAAGSPVTSLRGVHVHDTRSVYAIHPTTGAELWQHSVTAPRRMGQPFVDGEEVLVGNAVIGAPVPDSDGARTTVLDAATGAVSREFPGAIRALRGSRAVLLTNGWIHYGIIGGGWIRSVSGTVTDLDTTETLFGPATLFAASGTESVTQDVTLGADGFYTAFSAWDYVPCPYGLVAYEIAPTGTPQCGVIEWPDWGIAENGTTPILSDDQATLYFGSRDGTTFAHVVRAVDAATGAVLWSGTLPDDATGAPSLADGRLFVPTSASLQVFDAAGCGASTCAPSWSVASGAGSYGVQQAAIAGGVVYTGSSNGMVHAFDAAGCAAPPCAPIWSAATGSAITGAPAVSNGKLYVGTADGRLIAYGLPG